MRDRFLFYGSFWEALSNLTDEQKGQCLTVISEYALYGKEPSLENPIVRMFFTLVRPQIDANNQRFENGSKGGSRKKTEENPKNNQDETKEEPKPNQKITKEEPNGNQTETETEGNKKEKEKENNNTPPNNKLLLSPPREKKPKISFDEVFNWEDLFTYWEENKRGGKYKNQESRQRMLEKLKKLTENDFDYAKQAICHCLDSGYQGFCNGNELFYKGPKPQWKTINAKPDAFEIFNQAMDEIERRVSQ